MVKNISNFFLFLTFIISSFPLLTFGTRSVVTIIWALTGVVIIIKNKNSIKFNNNILFFLIPYLILITSLFYSANLKSGIDLLIKMISFIIYPIIILLNQELFTKKNIYLICSIFSVSTFILVVYQLINIGFNFDFLFGDITNSEIKSNGFVNITELTDSKINQIKVNRLRNYIIKLVDTHPTYQGLWISFILFFLFSKYNEIGLGKSKILIFLMSLILLTNLYLLSPRMPFLALIVSSLFCLFIFSKFSKKSKIYILITIIIGVSILLSFENPISIRFIEYYNTGFEVLAEKTTAKDFNSSNVRNGIYLCDVTLIKNQFIFGYGIGDVQDALNLCFKNQIKSVVYSWHSYNSHNQYFFFLLSSGILGFLSFIVLVFSNFFKSIKERKIILFFLTSLTSILFLTENILERSDGLIFYSFFTSLFLIDNIKRNKL